MTDIELKNLYHALRRYQVEKCAVGGKVYNAVDTVLTDLFPYYYNQNREQTK